MNSEDYKRQVKELLDKHREDCAEAMFSADPKGYDGTRESLMPKQKTDAS